MGRLKEEFHEVISGEHNAVEDLEAAHHAAWDAWERLHNAFPVRRTPEQNRQLSDAYNVLAWAKWKLDLARQWSNRRNVA